MRVDIKSKAMIFLAAVVLTAAPVFSQTPGLKMISRGEFKDRDGLSHTWTINGANALIWDGEPYMPVGLVFYSRYLSLGASEENWQADIRVLELAKSKGITSIIVKSVLPASWSDSQSWQKLIDYLDEQRFTYGLDFSDGPKTPLSGFVVDPVRYRIPDIAKDTSIDVEIPDAAGCLWVLSRLSDGRVISSGAAYTDDGHLRIDVKASSGEPGVLIIYPQVELSGGRLDGMSDLWSGFDEFRDRLIAFASKTKFGKGLRFVLDPISSKADLSGELAWLVPDSPEFRIGFEAYLIRKYKNIGSVNSAWALKTENIQTFEQAARLIPLWRGAKGVPVLFDRARGKSMPVEASTSRVWEDIQDYRDSSAQKYLNATADIVKRKIADVPVIYRVSKYHPVFANRSSRGGFDGLAIEASGHGEKMVTEYVGEVYSMVGVSSRTMWFVVLPTQDVVGKGSQSGYPSREMMMADVDLLAEIGAKGIFVHGLQILPDGTRRGYSLSSMPDQIDWLRETRDRFVAENRSDWLPKVLWYPMNPVVGGMVKRLDKGTWWLPSPAAGEKVFLGDAVGAYRIAGMSGLCLWSRAGESTVTFGVDKGDAPAVKFPDSAPELVVTKANRSSSMKKDKVEVKLTESPIVITGISQSGLFPVETAEAEIAKLDALIKRAKAAGVQVVLSEEALKSCRDYIKNGRTSIAYDKAHSFVLQLRESLGDYVWIEGETALSTFDSVVSYPFASEGAYLWVENSARPPVVPYTAYYSFDVTKSGEHEVWVAITASGVGISQFSFSIDGGQWQRVASVEPASSYGLSFVWCEAGVAALSKGAHTLQVRLDELAPDGNYRLGIDAIVLSPGSFKPSGVVKP